MKCNWDNFFRGAEAFFGKDVLTRFFGPSSSKNTGALRFRVCVGRGGDGEAESEDGSEEREGRTRELYVLLTDISTDAGGIKQGA